MATGDPDLGGGLLSCRARNGRDGAPREFARGGMARGRKSVDAIAVQAIEAQPSFGQIKAIRGEVFAG